MVRTKDVNELDLDQLQRYKEELRAADEELQRQLVALDAGADDRSEEMRALHRYNEMKDFAQAVVGYLANIEGVTCLELHQRFNLPVEQ